MWTLCVALRAFEWQIDSAFLLLGRRERLYGAHLPSKLVPKILDATCSTVSSKSSGSSDSG
jgi:hypothetical protein